MNCNGTKWILDNVVVLVYLYFLSLKYKLLEQVYRVSDMTLVRVLPSAEDEVNVACFHPSVGGGLVYGTKVSR